MKLFFLSDQDFETDLNVTIEGAKNPTLFVVLFSPSYCFKFSLQDIFRPKITPNL